MNINLIDELKENGIVKINNFLNENEKKKIEEILNFYSAPKSHPDSYFSTNLKQLIYKALKLKFIRLKHNIFLLNLSKKKKLNLIADTVFNKKSYLKYIDGYCSLKSDSEIIPWHTDQAYSGKKEITTFVDPDHANLKFFIYLTNVSSENGCMSYIPGSHKIGYAIRKLIFERKIEYSMYWNLKDFRKLISDKKNFRVLKSYLNDENIIEDFLNKTQFIDKNENNSEFDYNMNAGGAIIFDEGGVHRGSKTLKNRRLVLRYLYSITKSNLDTGNKLYNK